MKEEHDSAKADAQHAHVIVNCISGQFELVRCSEVVGVLEFKRAGKHFDLVRTYVSPEHRGQGYARMLVAPVLSAIKGNAGTITASCSYVGRVAASDEQFAAIVVPPLGESLEE
jgi:predicted GNAT family acetyltransferase